MPPLEKVVSHFPSIFSGNLVQFTYEDLQKRIKNDKNLGELFDVRNQKIEVLKKGETLLSWTYSSFKDLNTYQPLSTTEINLCFQIVALHGNEIDTVNPPRSCISSLELMKK